MLRLLHTADWHLGHSLYDYDRAAEHQRFLDWLLKELEQRSVDALIIAGDVFETANPPISALQRWYSFLAQATARCPDLDIVAIGGNHDSAPRLDAPEPLLSARVHVVGGLPRRSGRELDLKRMLIPLHDRDNNVAALIAAVPFLRVSDLPRSKEDQDPLIHGIQRIHEQVFAALFKHLQPGQAALACGHLYMQGTRLSLDSERKVLGGNQHPLPAQLFPEELAYVALGHLHLSQSVGRDSVRYSGSPIPLSMSEREYIHQVVLVELEGSELKRIVEVPIPRSVHMRRIPEHGYAELPVVLKALDELEAGGLVTQDLPFLELRVSLNKPLPDLRAQLEAALKGKAARLLAIHTQLTGGGLAAPDHPELTLQSPEQIFLRRWERDHEDAPSPALLAGFHELIEQAESS